MPIFPNSSSITPLTYSIEPGTVKILSWIVITGTSGRSVLIRSQIIAITSVDSYDCINRAACSNSFSLSDSSISAIVGNSLRKRSFSRLR